MNFNKQGGGEIMEIIDIFDREGWYLCYLDRGFSGQHFINSEGEANVPLKAKNEIDAVAEASSLWVDIQKKATATQPDNAFGGISPKPQVVFRRKL